MRFAERFGFRPASQSIQVEGMDAALRNSLWNIATNHFFPNGGGYLHAQPELNKRVRLLWALYYKFPLDTIDDYWPRSREEIKGRFLKADWYEVYDLFEFYVETYFDNAKEQKTFCNVCNLFLEKEKSGYRFAGNKLVRITSEEELAAVDAAQKHDDKFAPVSMHIRSAVDHIARRKNPDYRNSIKEAISAVEAACGVITGDPKATLGQALKHLEETGFPLHGAQKDAFSKLYGYTNDAEGIRHALLDEPSLTYEDAQFMLITCSAFVNYLRSAAKR